MNNHHPLLESLKNIVDGFGESKGSVTVNEDQANYLRENGAKVEMTKLPNRGSVVSCRQLAEAVKTLLNSDKEEAPASSNDSNATESGATSGKKSPPKKSSKA